MRIRTRSLLPILLSGLLIPLSLTGCSDDDADACADGSCQAAPGNDAGADAENEGGEPVTDAGIDGDVNPDGGLEKPMTASATIGDEGGTIEVLGLTLQVPAGALQADTLVTVTRTGLPAPGMGYTPLYRFDPAGLVFDEPVSVSFFLSEGFLSKPLTTFWSNIDDPTSYDDIGGTIGKDAIVANVSHFSTGYVGLSEDPEGDGGVEGDSGLDDGGIEDGGLDDGGLDDGGLDDGGVEPEEPDTSPELNYVSNTEVLQYTGDLPVTIGFRDSRGPMPETVIRVNGDELSTYFYSTLALTTLIPASYLTTTGPLSITAFTPNVGESNALELNVVSTGNAAPTIASVSPSAVAQNRTTNTTIVVLGSGFISGARCFLGPFPATLSFANQGQVNCILSANETLTAGDLAVRIINPSPGGGAVTGGPVTITGTNPEASIATVTPTTLGQGTATYDVDLSGSGFLPTTRFEALVGGEPRLLRSRFANKSTSAIVWIPDYLLASPGNLVIRATNPAPGGGSGTTVTLDVVAGNPTPQITRLSTTRLKKGQSGQKLTLTGTGFGAFSSLKETGTGSTLAIDSYTKSELVVTIPDALVSTTGTLVLQVVNAGPGGGQSLVRTVDVAGAPKLTSLSPNTVVAGSAAFALTLHGEDLEQSGYRVVKVGTRQLFPEGSWTVTVPADLIATPGALDVTVTIEGAGTSNALPLTVTAP